MIDLDWTRLNESGSLTVLRFGISIQYPIIQYQTRKSNKTRLIETISISIRSDQIQMWKIYYSFIQIIQILDITVDKEQRNA